MAGIHTWRQLLTTHMPIAKVFFGTITVANTNPDVSAVIVHHTPPHVAVVNPSQHCWPQAPGNDDPLAPEERRAHSFHLGWPHYSLMALGVSSFHYSLLTGDIQGIHHLIYCGVTLLLLKATDHFLSVWCVQCSLRRGSGYEECVTNADFLRRWLGRVHGRSALVSVGSEALRGQDMAVKTNLSDSGLQLLQAQPHFSAPVRQSSEVCIMVTDGHLLHVSAVAHDQDDISQGLSPRSSCCSSATAVVQQRVSASAFCPTETRTCHQALLLTESFVLLRGQVPQHSHTHSVSL